MCSITSIIITSPPFDALTLWGMIVLVAMVSIIFLKYCLKAAPQQKEVTFLTAFILFTIPAILAGSGILRVIDITPAPVMLLPPYILIISFAIGFSHFGKQLVLTNGVLAIVCLNAFRLPLELLMHHASEVYIMPQLFSYSGYNFDIISGALASAVLIIATLKKTPPRSLIWLWNITGILCLIAIFALAILSSPVVHAFGETPEKVNTWVLYFPYVWLPTILVVIALVSHIIVTRALLLKRN